MKHPIIQDLENRYTCKKYDPYKKIPEEKLEVLYEAIRLSASSINSQPWRFIVLSSTEAKKRMYDTFKNKFQFNQQHIMDASQVILFAHNPHYTKDDYAKVVDKGIKDGRTKLEDREKAFSGYIFAHMNTNEKGDNAAWTKSQLYLALGNTLHTLKRLEIDSTCLEGIDTQLVNAEFKQELGGYLCEVALAIGYHDEEQDFNAKLPKTRLSMESIFVHI